MKKYNPMLAPWQINEQDFPRKANPAEKLTFLLRYAILAPSSHNTQPWRFSVSENEIQVFADIERWQKVSDPDRRELHISIGCALENLLIAAEHFGYSHDVVYFPQPEKEELAAIVRFTTQIRPSPFREPSLFDAIPLRHTNRNPYETRPVPEAELQRLQNCIEEGILLYMSSDLEFKSKVKELITRADITHFSNSAYRKELGYWIGKGVFGEPWLLRKLGQLVYTHFNTGKKQAKEDSELLMSAPVLAVLSSKVNNGEAQIKTGQVFERLCLLATVLGIGVQPMSQILEIPQLKDELSKLLPDSRTFPQHFFRLGYAEQEKEHAPRRALEEVLVFRKVYVF